MRGFLFSVLAYGIVAFSVFGDPFKPLGLLIFWPDRLAAPWPMFVIGSGAVAALVFLLPIRVIRFASLKPPLFVALWMVLSIAVTALYVDRVRQAELAEFGADAVFQHSFLRSLQEAPREFQFYLHAGALRNCVPYAWSYRRMAVYRLPPDAAVNVLPPAWIERCGIAPTR